MSDLLNKNSNYLVAKFLLALLVVGISADNSPAVGQSRSTRVVEITGFIEARNHDNVILYSPDGKILALPKIHQGGVELWNLGTGKMRTLRSSFNVEKSPADHAAFSNDSRFLAVSNQGRGITVWDLTTYEEVTHITTPARGWFSDMAFLGTQTTLLAITAESTDRRNEGSVMKWNRSAARWAIPTGDRIGTTVFDPTLELKSLSPAGRLAVLENDLHRAVFETETGKEVCSIRGSGGFVFSADGSILVSYDETRVFIWELPTGRLLRSFVVNPSTDRSYTTRNCLSLSTDKSMLALGRFGQSNVVGLVDLLSGKINTFECCPQSMVCYAVCFSPDGHTIATDTYATDKKDKYVKPLLKFWRITYSP